MKASAVFLVLLFVGIMATVTPVDVGATTISWNGGTPIVVQNTLTVAPGTDCTGVVQSMYVSELKSSYLVCRYGDERLKIGYVSRNGSPQGVVGFPYSNDVHILEGVCTGVTCRYSADQDMLVTQRPISQYGWGTVVFLHVSQRIKQVHSTSGVTTYVFDGSNPDYSVRNADGRYIWTGAYDISDNGKWLVVELRDAGLAVINTDTFEARQVLNTGRIYGFGFDPTMQLAVSDDGKSVAATGFNVGLAVIDIDESCGQKLMGDLSRQMGTINCLSSTLGISTIFPNFHYGEHPRFYGDGHQLEATINSWVDGRRQITLLAHGATPAHKLKLLALGDSFTSGEGETDSTYYENGTNDRYDTCHISKRSYPLLVAASIGISTTNARSVACAGAKIGDIIGSGVYWGQKNRLGDAGLKLSDDNRIVVQEQATQTIQPGIVRQSRFLDRYNPEIITIGIGGNDAGLIGKLSVCAMPGTCEWAKGEGLKATAGEIRRLYDTLGGLFANIATRHQVAKVFVVGYPDIIKADGVCSPLTRLLLNYSERVFMQNAIHYLNQVIHAAAQKANFTYLDVEQSLKGRNLCSGASSMAINELRAGDDIPITNVLPMLKVIGSETFHPTPMGHSLIADAILSGHPGLRQDITCLTDPMACTISPIDITPSSYWGTVVGVQTGGSFFTDFATAVPKTPNQFKIESPGGAFRAGSIVSGEIHSDFVSLGQFIVNANGAIEAVITVPESLDTGFHTLHLNGLNQLGEPIDLYQFVALGKDDGVVTTDDTFVVANSVGRSLDTVIKGGFGTETSTTGKVLGVSVDGTILKPLRDIERASRNNGPLLLIIAGVVAVAGLIVVVVLFVRRWAKTLP